MLTVHLVEAAGAWQPAVLAKQLRAWLLTLSMAAQGAQPRHDVMLAADAGGEDEDPAELFDIICQLGERHDLTRHEFRS